MTKPHEKTWKVVQTPQGFYVREPSDRGPAYEPSVCMVYAVSLERLPDEPGAGYFQRTEEATASVSSLISAAPDMARHLLICVDSPHLTESFKDEMRATLKKAGALP